MAEYINKIRTEKGDMQIDYNALANKPTSLPANGGNADTLGGVPANKFAMKDESVSANGGTLTGNLSIGDENTTSERSFSIWRKIGDVVKRASLYWTSGGNFRIQANIPGVSAGYNYLQLNENDTTLGKPLAVNSGGTGANNAKDALANLGALPVDGSVPMTGMLTLPTIALKKGGGYARTVRYLDADGNQLGSIGFSDNDQLLIRQYCIETGKNEYFTLPQVPEGLSANNGYYFLTSRDPVTVAQGGTGANNGTDGLKNLFAAGPTVLSSNQYGDSLPTAGTAGRFFLKRLVSK